MPSHRASTTGSRIASRLRRSSTLPVVLALVAAVPVLVTAPAAAQDDDDDEPIHPTEIFIFSNAMTNPDDDNDGESDTRWQVRVTVTALGNCVPNRGERFYDSFWLDAGEEVATKFAPTACVFRIAARARMASLPDCEFSAQLAWADDNGNAVGTYRDDSVLTAARPGDESRLLARRNPDRGCSRPHRTYFVLDGSSVVEELPGASAEAGLLARARRAAAVAEYVVVVESETRATGCDIVTNFTVKGDRTRSEQTLGATGDSCPSRASIVAAPAPVRVSEGSHVEFDASLPNILVDLTSLVDVEAARIAIVQHVQGSYNRGAVTYSIARSCGGVPLASPPAEATSSRLLDGRFTVHSPDIPRFGPVETYPAVATAPDSFTVVGCAVTVTVSDVPAGCTVDSGNTQTLAWSATDPFLHFDFEFAIACGDAASAGPPTVPQPPLAADDAEDMVPDEGDEPAVADGDDSGDLEEAEPAADPVGPPRDAPTG